MSDGWNSGEVAPSCDGMYERDTSEVGEMLDVTFNYFSDGYWRIGDGDKATPMSSTPSSHQNLPWRAM